MNPNKTMEYNSLSWVKAQLDDVLSDAQINLNDYIENQTEASLENCLEHLQLIQGTLQMVEVHGASMLAEEMQHTIKALLGDGVDSETDAYDVLMRSMLQLPDYLEGIQAGKADAPMALMPLINDLRVVRNDSLLSQGVLFSPDIENAELDSKEYNSAAIESGKLQEEVKRLRTHYQLGLLDYIRNGKQLEGLKRIKAVLYSLEKVSSNSEVRHIWMVAGALIDGLLDEGIEDSLSVQKLLGSVDRQFKLILDLGETEFVNHYSKELVTNILYYVGLSTVDSESVVAIKNAYKLSELLPGENNSEGIAAAGLNADLFDTVSKGINEDLGQIKDVLELFMHSSEKDTEQLVPLIDQLVKVGDTYGMLGMDATRQAIMNQCDVLKNIISGAVEAEEKTVLDIATVLLNAESELRDYIDERSGFVDMNRNSEVQNVPSAEYRQVVFSAVSEGLKNFSEAKEAVLLYVTGHRDNEKLEDVLNRLEEVRGVAMMLPMGRVEAQLDKLQNYIRVALLDNQHQPAAEEQDTVADVVTSIEYFFEALSEGRPGVEQGLDTGDVAAEKLDNVVRHYTGEEINESTLTDVDTVETEDQDIATADIEVPKSDNDLELEIQEDVQSAEDVAFDEYQAEENEVASPEATEVEAAETEVTAAQSIDAQPDETEQYAILSDDADEEIVEIFIEEAVEVLGELNENFPQWKNNPGDEEALATIRRCFHTLKGSGRLMGAELIGEFSWRFESMLNRLIDKKISVSDSLLSAIDEALAVLPQLIEQLKGNREPISNIAQLMSTADAIAEGKEVLPEAVVSDSKVVEEIPESFDSSTGVEAVIDEVDNKVSDVEDRAFDVEASHSEIIEPKLLEPESLAPESYELEASGSESLNSEAIDFEPAEPIDSAFDEAEFSGEEVTQLEGVEENPIEEAELSISEEVDNVIDTAGESTEVIAEEVTAEEVTAEAEDVISLDIPEVLRDEISDESDEHVVLSDADDINEAVSFTTEEEPIGESGSSESIELESDIEDVEVSEISEAEDAIDTEETFESDNDFGIDTDLLQIYHDESISHIEVIREQLNSSNEANESIAVNKDLMRAFHTLCGSARTAGVDAIAELAGATEKYLVAHEDNGVQSLPSEGVQVLKEIETSVTLMLQELAKGDIPTADNDLQEKIDLLVQQEITNKPQSSWQEDEDAIEVVSTEELQANELSETIEEDVYGVDDIDVETGALESSTSLAEVEIQYGDVDDELIDIYLEEADELLESCEQVINELKVEPNSTEIINKLQRNMHTLKGGARMAELTPVGDLTHNLESLVVMVEDKKFSIDDSMLELLQESLDVLTSMIAAVKKRETNIPVGDLNERIEGIMRGESNDTSYEEESTEDLRALDSEEHEITSFDQNESVDVSEESSVVISADIAVDGNEENRKPERRRRDDRATDVNYKESQEQVRVRADLLNNLVDYAGEVNIYHARMGKQVSDFGYNLAELTQTVDRLKEQLRKLEIETEIQIRSGYEKESDSFDANFDPLEMDQYSTLQQLTRSLSETANDVDSIHEILSDITRDTETLLVQESRISTDLQEGLMRTRMVRFGGLSSRLRRIVRQVARELGKEVELKVNGESCEVDRTILDRIIAPLEHMLRNSVAHGIESPDIRKANGKNEKGLITVTVDRQGTDVVIDVQDDGAGIDVNKIREKAINQGLMTADSEISDRDALQFILHSGFSTAEEVTQVAGRGVGMDVVDSEIKQLGGVLDIDTTQGKGSEFRLRLPLTLAINQALLVNTADDVFAIPLASIEGVVRVTGVELQSFYDSENSHYEFNGVEYELKHLGGLISGHQANYSKQLQLFPVLLVNVGDQHFALHVESLIGRREIVVKPVGMQIGSVHGIAGATILADGRVVLILEMSALVVADSLFGNHAVEEDAGPVSEIDDVKTIMVVDDSITIRKITERMLKRYGANVILAKDGVDATNLLQEQIPDMMLLDIEMPRMDGFEVASYVRNDERLKDIPIIMITSRTGSKHKDKAMEIGVNQYLGKPFKEEELINNINDILNTSF